MHYTKTNERGITLIALVLTIVVMVIIAGISVAVAIDSNGLINKTSEEIGKTNTSIRIKTISEALSRYYIKNQGKLYLSDLPEKVIGSNDEEYEVNYIDATIGGFTFEELGIIDVVEKKIQLYCVGKESTKKYYLYNIDSGRVSYYEDDTKKLDFNIEHRPGVREYTDEINNTTFKFLDKYLIVTNSKGEMLYSIKNDRSLYELDNVSYSSYSNSSNKCNVSNGVMNFRISNNEISGNYAAIKESSSSSTRTVYLVINNSEGNELFYKGTEEYDINNRKRILNILDEEFQAFFYSRISD